MSCVLVAFTSTALAGGPDAVTMNVQVYQPDDPFGFSYQGEIKLELFDDPDAGSLLWAETHSGASLSNGFIALQVGTVNTVTPIGSILANHSSTPLFLEVTFVGLGQTLPQRVPLTSVPYAMVAGSALDATSLDGLSADDLAGTAHKHDTSTLTDWPDQFPPTEHDHDWFVLTSGVPGVFPPDAHDHALADITNKPEWLGDGGLNWDGIADKPAEFPPQQHAHGWIDLADLPDTLADEDVSWDEVTGKPAAFPVAAHEHDNQYLAVGSSAVDSLLLDGYTSSDLAKADATYTKEEVDAAIAAEVAGLASRLWCLESCDDSVLLDCQARTCIGSDESCEVTGQQPDGTLCQGPSGAGACQAGQCQVAVGLACGNTVCPDLVGNYAVECNKKGFCEYANVLDSDWRKHDVWIYVPPGTFPMGSPDQEEGHTSSEAPVHDVTFVQGFFIMKYEVTVAQYEVCQADGDCTSLKENDSYWHVNSSLQGEADHPMNAMCYKHAQAVCSWLHANGRPASEAEWEYAAKGPVHTKWVWGIDPPPSCAAMLAVYDEDGVTGRPWGCDSCTTSYCSGTDPVGSMPEGAAWCGAMDMAGNVAEFVADYVEYGDGYDGAPTDGGPWILGGSGHDRVIRGGSYKRSDLYLRPASRLHTSDNCTSGNGIIDVGVRCARPLTPPQEQ